jgi:hypothetical protein
MSDKIARILRFLQCGYAFSAGKVTVQGLMRRP